MAESFTEFNFSIENCTYNLQDIASSKTRIKRLRMRKHIFSYKIKLQQSQAENYFLNFLSSLIFFQGCFSFMKYFSMAKELHIFEEKKSSTIKKDRFFKIEPKSELVN